MTSRTFEPAPDQVRVARTFVLRTVDAAGGSVPTGLKDDLALLTSEAVANAVEHARTPIDVTVNRIDRGSFVVSVHDDSPKPIPEATAPGSVGSGSGRGLAIIDAVAASWGVEDLADDGKTIWFVAGSP